uniref:NifB/NifX family molybdenum-iron cluster-binding protein n=1 Tax=uncultured Draconibacterium sp. TaxID=1573823 RepID=UPI003217A9BE
MKIIITSTGDNLNAKFDLRFGRAGWFCVYDKETKTSDFIKNNFKDLNGGAGTKSSEMVAELGAQQVVSGHFGPKAKDMLERFNIQMIAINEGELEVAEIINKLQNN